MLKKIINLFLILFMIGFVNSVMIFETNQKINQLYFPSGNTLIEIKNINVFFVSVIVFFGIVYLPYVCLFILN